MTTDIKLLMVDDHPLILEGYLNILNATKKPDQNLIIDLATSADEAMALLKKANDLDALYNVIFLDIKIPPSKSGDIKSGEDIAKHVRENFPKTKIIILTMFNEAYRIHNIVTTINPEGFLIKSDMTASELSSAFKVVLTNPPFYSGTINKSLRDAKSLDLNVDANDRKILHFLAQGIKTKNLTKYINLSLSSIEKRKHNLKIILGVEQGIDDDLVAAARNKGLL